MRRGTSENGGRRALTVGFVLHVMQVAGAEMLVYEIVKTLGSKIEPVVFCLDGVGALGERLRREGVPVIALNRTPGVDLRLVRRFADEVRRRQIDVLHAHQYTPFFYAALASVAARGRARVVFTEHGRHWPDVVGVKRRWLNRLVLKRLATLVTGVSQFSVDAIVRNDGFAGSDTEVITNGIHLDRYGRALDQARLRRELGLRADRRYIACVARFHPVKDHRTLIDAFGRVASDLADVDLLLAGDGPLRAELEAMVAQRGLSERVHFLGVRSDAPRLLSAVDVFALSSLSEAASITVLEAMASGLPVVATDVGGNPEMIRRGVDGLLVPRSDVAAFADALREVLSDSQRAATMGDNGRRRVEDVYRIDRTISRYYDIYAAVAAA